MTKITLAPPLLLLLLSGIQIIAHGATGEHKPVKTPPMMAQTPVKKCVNDLSRDG